MTIIVRRNWILLGSLAVCAAGLLVRHLITVAMRVNPDEIDLGVIAP